MDGEPDLWSAVKLAFDQGLARRGWIWRSTCNRRCWAAALYYIPRNKQTYVLTNRPRAVHTDWPKQIEVGCRHQTIQGRLTDQPRFVPHPL